MKITFPLLKMGFRRSLAAALFLCAFSPAVHAQYDLSGFLPPGVSINNATPQQISEAVLAAVQKNPDAAADIAAGTFQSVFDAGRYTLSGAQDGKQSADPDGSSSDPTLDEWVQIIGDSAKQGNPALGPQIDSALAKVKTTTGDPGGGGGGGGDGGPPTPTGFPGGGGGGGGSSPASN